MADFGVGDIAGRIADRIAKELVNNIPYVAMMMFGAAIFSVGFAGSKWGLILAVVYLAYGAAGAFWIMIFVCPYCRYWKYTEFSWFYSAL